MEDPIEKNTPENLKTLAYVIAVLKNRLPQIIMLAMAWIIYKQDGDLKAERAENSAAKSASIHYYRTSDSMTKAILQEVSKIKNVKDTVYIREKE